MIAHLDLYFLIFYFGRKSSSSNLASVLKKELVNELNFVELVRHYFIYFCVYSWVDGLFSGIFLRLS